ncbi:MAG: inner membrane CreD family protein [Vicinamibacteria bacterium]
MSPIRLLAIGLVFVCTAIAWFVLGATVVKRTGESDGELRREVMQLWGGTHHQVAPQVLVERPRTVVQDVEEKDAQGRVVTRKVTQEVIDQVPVPLEESRVQVALRLDPRQKGLLWYDTYAVAFRGTYRLRNPDAVARRVHAVFKFPSSEGVYDDFVFRVDGGDLPPRSDLSEGVTAALELAPGAASTLEIGYRSRGLGPWTYAPGTGGVSHVRDFQLDLDTDFGDVDFPAGSLSPTTHHARPGGHVAQWRFASLVTGQTVGMDPPDRLNPGPLASRITFFAPVSLLFFFTVLVILGVLRGHSLHPMNYFFLAAAFFAFHLLLAYLVDHLDVHVAFAAASAVSVFLVVSYLRIVAGVRAALLEAGAAQLVFLVLFGYAFFFDGYTGLTVTVGAVVTLFVLMQLTARVDWGAVFARRDTA